MNRFLAGRGRAAPPGLPHFLGIGAQRSGTTWLYQHLRAVPGLWLPPVKELHYFDRIDPGFYRNAGGGGQRAHRHVRERLMRNARHLGVLLPRIAGEIRREGLGLPAWAWRYYLGKPSDRWYAELFRQAARRGLVTGEITPGYSLLSQPTVARIGAINPGLKVLFIMRDPVERMWSGAVKRLAADRGRSLSDVPESEFSAFFAWHRTTSRANYMETLARWESVFPAENVHVEFFESIEHEPDALLRRVVGFLGLPPDAVPRADPSRGRNAVTAGGPPIPLRLHGEIARVVEPHLEALAARYPEKAHEWRQRHLAYFPHDGEIARDD